MKKRYAVFAAAVLVAAGAISAGTASANPNKGPKAQDTCPSGVDENGTNWIKVEFPTESPIPLFWDDPDDDPDAGLIQVGTAVLVNNNTQLQFNFTYDTGENGYFQATVCTKSANELGFDILIDGALTRVRAENKNGKAQALSHFSYWVEFIVVDDGDDPEVGDDTAFAKADDGTCFIGNGFNRWGWTNQLTGPGSVTWDVWAGAGQCDLDNGVLAGTVTVNYSGGTVTVVWNLNNGFTLKESHVYAGQAPYPTGPNGKPTVAPGSYEIGTGLSGSIYVIVHGVVEYCVANCE